MRSDGRPRILGKVLLNLDVGKRKLENISFPVAAPKVF